MFSVRLKLEVSLMLKGTMLKGMDCLVPMFLQFSVDPDPTRITHSGDASRALAHWQHGSEHLIKVFLLMCFRCTRSLVSIWFVMCAVFLCAEIEPFQRRIIVFL
jgi:hypothetical protein